MGQASKGLNPAYILIFIMCGISKAHPPYEKLHKMSSLKVLYLM